MSALDRQLSSQDREELASFPQLTESGPIVNEYTTETARGYETEAEAHDARLTKIVSHTNNSQEASPTATLHEPFSAGDVEKAAGIKVEKESGDLKLVTFLIDDKQNPKNWSKVRKWFCTVIVALMCVTVGIGSSVIVLSFDELVEPKSMGGLGISLDVAHLTACLFVLGFGLGPLFFAPLSELYGRAPIYFISMGLYLVFTFPCAFAKNGATLVVCRFLAGLSASAPMTNAGGSISDLWSVEERGVPMLVFSGMLFVGPTLGPVIGGFLPTWRWVYRFLLLIVGPTWILVTFGLPETYAPAILLKRAKKMRKETGDDTYITEQERHKKTVKEIVIVAVGKPLKMLATESIIICFSGYLSLCYALLYVFFFAFPYVFVVNHGFNKWQCGLSFLSVLIGMLVAFCTISPYQNKYFAKKVAEAKAAGTSVTPEARLPAMIFGAFLMPISLFIFAFASYPRVHWTGSAIGALLLGFCFVIVYNGANSYIVDAYPGSTASAIAAKTLISRVCGAAVTMFVDRYYGSAIGIEWASGVIAFIALLMIPIPLIFMKYGPAIRARSAANNN